MSSLSRKFYGYPGLYRRPERRRFRYRRRKGVLNMLRTRPYTLRQSVARMGPGTTTSRVTLRYTYEVPQENSAVVYMVNAMLNSSEFERNLPMFKYWKLIGVKIIIQPRVSENTGNDPTGRISVDWDNDILENVTADDSSKEIAPYSTKYQIYRFAPPDVLLTAANGKRINYKNWISSTDNLQDTLAPGYIKITSIWRFSFVVELIVLWKGNQTQLVVNDNKRITKHKDNIEEIIKENKINKNSKRNNEEANLNNINKNEIKEEDKKEINIDNIKTKIAKEIEVNNDNKKEIQEEIDKIEEDSKENEDDLWYEYDDDGEEYNLDKDKQHNDKDEENHKNKDKVKKKKKNKEKNNKNNNKIDEIIQKLDKLSLQ